MAGTNQGQVGGFERCQFSTLNTSGYWTGQGGTSPANGSTSHARLMRGGATFGFNPTSPTTITFGDADTQSGIMSFGGANQGAFDIELYEFDNTAVALTNSSNVDSTTNSVWKIASANAGQTTLPDMGIMIAQKTQSTETAISGLTRYRNWIIPVCSIRAVPTGGAYQAETTHRYTVTPRPGGRFPNGVAFGANQGWANYTADLFWIDITYPLAYTAFIGDNSATTFNTAYKPISTTVTNGATENWFAKAGTAEALTSITLAGVATTASTLTAGQFGGLLYETRFVAV